MTNRKIRQSITGSKPAGKPADRKRRKATNSGKASSAIPTINGDDSPESIDNGKESTMGRKVMGDWTKERFDDSAIRRTLSDAAISALTSADIPEFDSPEMFRSRFSALLSDRDALSETIRPTKYLPNLLTGDLFFDESDVESGPPVTCSPTVRFSPTEIRIPALTSALWWLRDFLRSVSATDSVSTELVVVERKSVTARILDRVSADIRRNESIPSDRSFVASESEVIPLYRGGKARQDIGAGQYGRKKERNEKWCSDLASFEPIPPWLILDRSEQFDLDETGKPVSLPDSTPWRIVTAKDVDSIGRISRWVLSQRDAEYSTSRLSDDWEDIRQDALIRFSALLAKSEEWECVETDEFGQPVRFRFEFVRQTEESGDEMLEGFWEESDDDDESSEDSDSGELVEYFATRSTIYRWAVRDAIRRMSQWRNPGRRNNGDGPTFSGMTSILGEPECAEGKWQVRRSANAAYVNTAYLHTTTGNPLSESTFWQAFGDFDSRPLLARILTVAINNPSKTKAGILTEVARESFPKTSTLRRAKELSLERAAEEYVEFLKDLDAVRGDSFRWHDDD